MNKITIIIPTFNNPFFLRRVLEYYDSFSIKFKIIIGDSSNDKIKKINKDSLKKFKNLKIEYVDEYSEKTNPYIKFFECIKKVKTKYIVFCAEDDFITPEGIRKSVDFLEKNKDYICCQGNYVGFSIYKNKLYFRDLYSRHSINSDNINDRISNFFKDYSPLIYAVYKKRVLYNSYKFFMDLDINKYHYGELVPYLISLIYGKLKHLDTLYCLKNIKITYPFCYNYAFGSYVYGKGYKRDYDYLCNKIGPLIDSKFSIKNSFDNYINIIKKNKLNHFGYRVNLLVRNYYLFNLLFRFLGIFYRIYYYNSIMEKNYYFKEKNVSKEITNFIRIKK